MHKLQLFKNPQSENLSSLSSLSNSNTSLKNGPKNLKSNNPIDMEGYEEKLDAAMAKTDLNEAVITGRCKIDGNPVMLGIMSFDFMGGSMGSVVGEKVTRLIEKAIELRIPVMTVTSSGGARMQEGALSLMQMAKTSCAVAKLNEAKNLGLKVQEQQARGLLRNCLSQEKRVLGMQMQLELAVQSRDLSNLQQAFLTCVGNMADEIESNVTVKNVKKNKKKYIKSLFRVKEQNERMDEFLQEGDYAMAISTNSNESVEFDEEIDDMLENLELDKDKYKNKF